MNKREQLEENINILRERMKSKEVIEREKNNELNRFCRDIESLTRAGYNPQESYRIVKNKYRRTQ